MRSICSALLLAVAATLAPAVLSANDADTSTTLTPRYKLATNKGDIVLELDGRNAPGTTLNFDQYVKDGFYNGTIFHRVIKDFMIQGGGFTVDNKQKREGLRSGIKNEWQNGLKNNRGTISMARIGRQPDSATAQFFINLKDNGMLDQPNDGAAYAVFGQVVEGLNIVDDIANVTVQRSPAYGNAEKANPVEPIVINEVVALSQLDTAQATVLAEEYKASETKRETERKEAATKKSKAEVETFLAAKEAQFAAKRETTASGLISVVMKPGTGDRLPKPTDKVSVHYTGMFLNGTKFDSSVDRGQPFEVNLQGGVIQGWLEGLRLMKEGEKRVFVMPPSLAYGEGGSGGVIPPNATLVFEIEMLKIM